MRRDRHHWHLATTKSLALAPQRRTTSKMTTTTRILHVQTVLVHVGGTVGCGRWMITKSVAFLCASSRERCRTRQLPSKKWCRGGPRARLGAEWPSSCYVLLARVLVPVCAGPLAPWRSCSSIFRPHEGNRGLHQCMAVSHLLISAASPSHAPSTRTPSSHADVLIQADPHDGRTLGRGTGRAMHPDIAVHTTCRNAAARQNENTS